MDVNEFKKRGKEMIDFIAEYYENVDNMPPMSSVKPGYLYSLIPHEAPEEPESFENIQQDIETKIMPGMMHWQSSNFFGWYPSSGSFPAMLGDMTHSAGQKATSIIGCQARIIPSDANFRLTKCALQAAITKDRQNGLIPFFVCATFGTTNTAAIDDLYGIADVADSEHLWLHIDAAYAGAALTCPEFRPLARGIDRAHSFNFNPHKWLLTNFDCSALWVADSTHLVNALSIEREYLPKVKGATDFVKDYRNWELPLGRRFRSLKLWFVMRMYGASGIRAYIRKHVKEAKWLEAQLLEDGRFEIMAPVVFGLVVFRVKSGIIAGSACDVNKTNAELVRRINNDGRVFLVGTNIRGVHVLRPNIGSTYGTSENTALLVKVIKECTTKVIAEYSKQ
ncbi:hypothetical protein J3F80_000702 [Coemansia sp. RSA 2526]|nr:hypothetical protein J3F80_000702 [Coemansia sp. RSA 2526]